MRVLDYVRGAACTARLKLALTARPPRERAVERALVIGYAAIGDLIFFLPALRALRETHPKARITFIANRYPTTEELLPATGLVDEIWFHDWEGPQALAEQGAVNARVAAARFDLALLTLSAPAHYFQRGLATIPLRAGHCRRLEGGTAWQKVKRALVTGELARRALLNRVAWIESQPEHSQARNLRLARAAGLTPPADPRPALPISAEHRARAERELPGGPWIGVHIVGPQRAYRKIWEAERFAEACRELLPGGKARFAIVGSREDAEAAARALKVFPGMVDLVGKLSLLETFAAIARCRLFLSSDTGMAKAAMALGVPTATWWGPSDPREYGIVWEPEKHLDIRTGIWCSPCSHMGMAKGETNYLNCGHHDCLAKLDVGQAVRQLRAKYADLLE